MELKDYNYDLRIDPITKKAILRFQLKNVPTDNWTSVFNRNSNKYSFVSIMGTPTVVVTLNTKDLVDSSYLINFNRYHDSQSDLYVSGVLTEIFLPSLRINGVVKYFQKKEHPSIETKDLLLEITQVLTEEEIKLFPIGQTYTVISDGSGKQSLYMWNGSEWIKISDTYEQKIEANLLDVTQNSGIVKITFDDDTRWSYDYATQILEPDTDFYPLTYPSDSLIHSIDEINSILTTCFNSINAALMNFNGSGSAYSSYSYSNYFTELISSIEKTDTESDSDLNKIAIYRRVLVPGICIVHDGLNSIGPNSELENFLKKVVNNQTLS